MRWRVLVAGVRAAAGDDRADDDHRRGDGEQPPGERAQWRGPSGLRGVPSAGSVSADSAYAAAITAIESRKWQADQPTG